MTEPIEIEGWTCRLVRGQRSAQNYAQEIGAWLLPDGRFKTEGLETDGSTVLVTIPPAVLAWLVAPLIDRGYGTGHAAGMATAREIAQQRIGFEESRETPAREPCLCCCDTDEAPSGEPCPLCNP